MLEEDADLILRPYVHYDKPTPDSEYIIAIPLTEQINQRLFKQASQINEIGMDGVHEKMEFQSQEAERLARGAAGDDRELSTLAAEGQHGKTHYLLHVLKMMNHITLGSISKP